MSFHALSYVLFTYSSLPKPCFILNLSKISTRYPLICNRKRLAAASGFISSFKNARCMCFSKLLKCKSNFRFESYFSVLLEAWKIAHPILSACKPGLYSPQSSKREQNGGHTNELSSVFASLIVCREFPCPLFLLQERGYRTAYHETYTILTSKASCSSSKQEKTESST